MRLFSTLTLLMMTATAFCNDTSYVPTKENLEARESFQDSKFGLFIHWGAYSVLERGEWVMNKENISIENYTENATSRFNPTHFDPKAWVSLAKDAGMKYITITSKHHDGFAMWGTQQCTWNVVDGSPYQKDILKMLAEECHHQGIKLFFYYSQLDWHHTDYFPLGRSGLFSGRPTEGSFPKYIEFMNAQLEELLTQYGEIGGIWFDGMWDKPNSDWQLDKTYSLIHKLQPAALVGSNHHLTPFDGEDFQMFEKDLPGKRTQRFNSNYEISHLPLESCETINHSWGYSSKDDHYKSTKDLIQYLVKAAGSNSNLLLNIGPRPDGTIQPEFVERLQEIGTWMRKYGDSIYGTRQGPLAEMPWGVTTQKHNKVYLHLLDHSSETLSIPLFGKIVHARLFPTGPAITFEQVGDELLLQIPKEAKEPVDTIIELEIATL